MIRVKWPIDKGYNKSDILWLNKCKSTKWQQQSDWSFHTRNGEQEDNINQTKVTSYEVIPATSDERRTTRKRNITRIEFRNRNTNEKAKKWLSCLRNIRRLKHKQMKNYIGRWSFGMHEAVLLCVILHGRQQTASIIDLIISLIQTNAT